MLHSFSCPVLSSHVLPYPPLSCSFLSPRPTSHGLCEQPPCWIFRLYRQSFSQSILLYFLVLLPCLVLSCLSCVPPYWQLGGSPCSIVQSPFLTRLIVSLPFLSYFTHSRRTYGAAFMWKCYLVASLRENYSMETIQKLNSLLMDSAAFYCSVMPLKLLKYMDSVSQP